MVGSLLTEEANGVTSNRWACCVLKEPLSVPSQIHNVAAATANHSAYSISACCWLLDTQPRGLPPNTDSNLVLAQGSQCKSAAILQSRKLWNIINNIKTESRRSKSFQELIVGLCTSPTKPVARGFQSVRISLRNRIEFNGLSMSA